MDFVTFTEKIRNGKLQFFAQCSEIEEAADIILTLTILSNHFWTMFPFYTPCKRPKIFGFLVFSKGINWELWLKTGLWPCLQEPETLYGT